VGDDFRARLQARFSRSGIAFTDSQLDLLQHYFDLLKRWNRKINLTSLPLDPLSDPAIDRLFVEPVAATLYIRPFTGSWLDLGSGGGSPAIPLKIVMSQQPLTLVEARSRKAAFLREVVRELRLTDTAVEPVRLETLSSRMGFVRSAGLVSARAVRADGEFFRAVRELVADAGQLLLFSSAEQEAPSSPAFDLERTVVLVSGSNSVLHRYAPSVPRGTF
jgi:16S rRNA (guanine527-N7)-methyltransferase